MATTRPCSRSARFDRFEVDLVAGELRKSGQRVALQDQPFQILRLLIESAPEIVTREQISSVLWPSDTFVDFDLAINTAIKKLRQALDDSPDQSRFIRTLAKRGYRFTEKVDWVDEPPAVPDKRTEERVVIRPGSPWRKSLLIKAGVVLLASVALVLVWWIAQHHPEPPLTAVPVTSLQGGAGWMSFSPDGQQIVFGWNKNEGDWNYFVKTIGGPAQPFQVTHFHAPNHIASQPTWSPDGKWIAFARWNPVPGQKPVEVVLTPAPMGGHELTLLRINDGQAGPISWSPDAKYLAYVDHDSPVQPSSIFLLRRDALERIQLTSPPAGSVDSYPVFSPDGRQIVFARSPTDGIYQLSTVTLGSAKVNTLLTETGTLAGLTWDEHGRDIIYSSDKSGVRRLWRVSASGGKPWPLAVGEDGQNPTVSGRASRLAYARRLSDTNVWRIDLGTGKKVETRTSLTVSTRQNRQPAYSPDGTRIVFTSDRSGYDEIWTCNGDGSEEVQLTHFKLQTTGTPRWSPDGKQIAFDSRVRGHADIYVVGLNGADPRRVTDDGYDDMIPSWSADGRWIYYTSNRSGDKQIWKVPSEGGQAVQVTQKGGISALESPDGKALYYVTPEDTSQVWQKDLPAGNEYRLAGMPAIFDDALTWEVKNDGIYFAAGDPFNAAQPLILQFFDFKTKKVRTVTTLGPLGGFGIAIGRDGRTVLYSQEDQGGVNIMLVENFH